MRRIPVFGIQLERMSAGFFEPLAHLSFDKRLNHQGDEKDEHIGLDSVDSFKQQGGRAMEALELGEAFFNAGLVRVTRLLQFPNQAH